MKNGWLPDMYIKIYLFAAKAHQGKNLPGTELPYIVHVNLVAMEVIKALTVEQGRDENLAVQCALLHDVIEDTPITAEQLESEYGLAVAAGVLSLSKNENLCKQVQLPDSLDRIKQQPQ